MRRRAAALLLTLMSGAALPAAARADVALAVIDACIAHLDAEFDDSYARIATRCPQLGTTLRTSDWAAWLPTNWADPHNRLSAKSLGVLRGLVAEELVLRPMRSPPAVAQLRPILASLKLDQEERRSIWARLQAWLRGVLAPRADTPPESSFARLFGNVTLSQALLRLVSCTIVVLVAGLAAFIVANEWRARPARFSQRKAGGWGPQPRPTRHESWQDIEAAAAVERPRMLLEVLAARLTAARRLPAAAALTVRELTRAAELGAEDRARLFEVALASEQLRYGAQLSAPAGLAAVLERGRQLLERLERPCAGSA